MAGKTNLSATLFSQKKLLGKTSTGTHRADSNEPIPSGVQVAASTIFAEDIPSSPNTTMYQVQSASNGGPATVEYVEFVLQEVTGSTYDANSFDSEAGSQSSGVHAYRLVLTSTYEANSNNTKKGGFPYRDSQILHWTLGGLQLVGPQFSNDVPNPYNLTVYSGSRDVDDQIPLLDEIDWQIDYYSGILFVQDFDATKIPTRAKGYIYVGKYLSASLGDLEAGGGGGGGGGGSSDTKDVGWFGSNGSISTTGSVYIGTANTSNPETFFSSVGAAIFNEQGRAVDFRVESSNKTHAFFVDGDTDQILIHSGGAANSYNEAAGSDVNMYVSGSVDSRGTAIRGTTVFGGDVVLSGTLSINRAQAGVGSFVTVTSDGKVGIGSDTPAYKLSVGGNMDVGEYIYHKNDADTFIQFEPDQIKFSAGNETMLTLREHGQDVVTVGGHGSNVDFQVSGSGDFNALFVDSSAGRVGMGTNSPSSILHITEESPPLTLQREDNSNASTIDFKGQSGNTANSIIHDSTTNDLVFKTFNGSTVEEILRFGDHYGTPNRQIIMLSGSSMHADAMQPRESADIAFFVSGAIGSRGTSTKGTSVFGGDVVVSGSLTTLGDGASVSFNGGNGSDNQMITADGSGGIVAESNITFNGSTLSVTGDILPGTDNSHDLGSPTQRWANIYTGDLHLRNERGHWQIVEERDCLTVINRHTGKRYKMVLEPYDESADGEDSE